MEIEFIAGTISTTIFTLSNIPMIRKAVRTRSLHSYSYTHILMNNIANLIHWLYVIMLPPGPIWFLHAFYTLSSALMFPARRHKRPARIDTRRSIIFFAGIPSFI
jgi:uncharacterized protein with PQ loop repeat